MEYIIVSHKGVPHRDENDDVKRYSYQEISKHLSLIDYALPMTTQIRALVLIYDYANQLAYKNPQDANTLNIKRCIWDYLKHEVQI